MPAAGSGEADPLLVVAAQGREPELSPAVGPPMRPDDDDLNYAEWLAASGKRQAPGSPWYPVLLADLSFVRDIGGGHPSTTRTLAGLLAVADSGFDPRLLLTPELGEQLGALSGAEWNNLLTAVTTAPKSAPPVRRRPRGRGTTASRPRLAR